MHPQDPTPPSRWRSPLGIFMLVAGAPMRAIDIIQQMEAKGLWKSPGGKTPALVHE